MFSRSNHSDQTAIPCIFATLTAWNNDRKIVFFAQFITQVAYAVVGLCAVVIFVVFNVVSRTEDDMIVYMSLINMRGNNIRIFPL